MTIQSTDSPLTWGLADAQAWVLEHVYDVKPVDAGGAREARLLALIERTDNDGERAAAQFALGVLRAKKGAA